MFCSAAGGSLRRLARELPSCSPLSVYLLPRLTIPYQTRSFSSSPTILSRIGGAAIPIPPEVSLRFIDLPKSNVRSRKKDVPVSAVEVSGPLGAHCEEQFLSLICADYRRRPDDPSLATLFDSKP